MVIEQHAVIHEFVQNMNIERSVQTGYINVPMTNMLADLGDVIFITESKFNPFEDRVGIRLVNDSYSGHSYKFKKKYGRLDLCVFGHMTQLSDFRSTLCAWTPVVRKNGVMVFLNSEHEDIQRVIREYTKQIDEDYFEITECADITFVRVL